MASPGETRTVRVPALAKLNLALKVTGKRPDGYHELRTVFQTISVADRLTITAARARSSSITVRCSVEIADNIALRAAQLLLDALKVQAHVEIEIDKQIPMGGGLGGGSTDAAAVLLTLPALLNKPLAIDKLTAIAAQLGSDVPFFLCGGTALGLSRGEELYPFPEPKKSQGLLLTPAIHVSTPDAYRALGRGHLTATEDSRIINSFQSLSWEIGEGRPVVSWRGFCQNDFESVVFSQHPKLQRLKKKLEKAGAGLAQMTGSGSAIFGFFLSQAQRDAADALFSETRTVRFHTVSRAQYRALWWKALHKYAMDQTWPPLSRYAT